MPAHGQNQSRHPPPPPVPQPVPGPKEAPPLLLPPEVAKEEKTVSSSRLWHIGHAGCLDPYTRASKWWPHFLQIYSNKGIFPPKSFLLCPASKYSATEVLNSYDSDGGEKPGHEDHDAAKPQPKNFRFDLRPPTSDLRPCHFRQRSEV
jgi:hypothetical protein